MGKAASDLPPEVLSVPCMPWLPRPSCLSKPPSATVILATWNLEVFALGADPQLLSRKVANMTATLQQLCREEGPRASVIVALQEVFDQEAVGFLARYLTERDALPGGSGRTWHHTTSGQLGNNAERAAFLWSGPPPHAQPRGGLLRQLLGRLACLFGGGDAAAEPPDVPLYSDPHCNFETSPWIVRRLEQAVENGIYKRSPFYGLFRVGHANLLVVNVHLAAEPEESRLELSVLGAVVADIQLTNKRLLRRYSLGGLLSGRQPRGLVAVCGDFNCPEGRAVAVVPPPPSTSTPAAAAAAMGRHGARPAAAARAGPVCEATARQAPQPPDGGRGPAGTRSPAAAASDHKLHAGAGQESGAGDAGGTGPGRAGAAGGRGQGRHHGGGSGGHNQGSGGAGARHADPAAANAHSWRVFRSHGWVNVLIGGHAHKGKAGESGPHAPAGGTGDTGAAAATGSNGAGATASNGASSHAAEPVILATNWRARVPKALDAICLQQQHTQLVTGRGVCRPPPYVDPAQPGAYPNHLLCWVRLDARTLQRAPGKLRPLLAPAVGVVAAVAVAAAANNAAG